MTSADKYTILLPLKFNDGQDVPPEVLMEAIDALYLLSGGYTIEGTVEGAYKMRSGAKQTDKLLKVSVLITSDQAEKLKALVRSFCRRLDQECMWLEKTPSLVEFIERDPPEGSEHE
jgi:hypothetical protein